MLGPYVKIISGNHILDYKHGPMNSSPPKAMGHDKGIIIEDDVWIGVGSTVLDGSHISEGSVIGAGSLVNRYIPPYVIAAGNPAKTIRARFSLSDLKTLLKSKNSKISIDEIQVTYTKLGIPHE
ncbi:Chloramphenicol acetyltransferase [compost metagenome]